MRHFEIAQWTDFVHGLTPPLEREVMANHLAGGCEVCARLVELVSRIQQAAAGEVTVPRHLVGAAKAVFPKRQAPAHSPAWALLPRLTAKLVFRKSLDLAPEGARSATESLVQVVYNAGDYAIELQLEPESESREIALVGQVINRAAAGEPVAGVPVRLMARKKLLATANSNHFGEFCIVSKLQSGLRLSIPIEVAGHCVEIPLGRLIAEILR